MVHTVRVQVPFPAPKKQVGFSLPAFLLRNGQFKPVPALAVRARLLLQRRNRAKRDLFNRPLTRTKKLMVLHARFAGSRLKSWWLFTRCNIFFGRIRGLVWRSLRRVRSSIPPRYSLRGISTSLRMTYSSFVKLYLSEMGDTSLPVYQPKTKNTSSLWV